MRVDFALPSPRPRGTALTYLKEYGWLPPHGVDQVEWQHASCSIVAELIVWAMLWTKPFLLGCTRSPTRYCLTAETHTSKYGSREAQIDNWTYQAGLGHALSILPGEKVLAIQYIGW